MIRVTAKDCRDCYKCLRACPLKAVRIREGHAEVAQDRCVYDGRCIPVCPQGAMYARESVEPVRGILSAGGEIAASVSPIAALAFGGAGGMAGLERMLRGMGFGRVEPSSKAGPFLAGAYTDLLRRMPKPIIASHCPAVVLLVEKHFPHLIQRLAPLASVSVVHARMLRASGGVHTRVVRIGPCLAEKAESEGKESDRPEGAPDAVVTIGDLRKWLAGEAGRLEDGTSGAAGPAGSVRLEGTVRLDLVGGLTELLRRAGILDRRRAVVATGLEACIRLLSSFAELSDCDLADLMACDGGCAGSPFRGSAAPAALCTTRMLRLEPEDAAISSAPAPADVSRIFSDRSFAAPMPDASERARLMAEHTSGLHCGACGFDNCAQKAAALHQGMAEVEMCMPLMRRKAAHASAVLEHTPNGVLMVDRDARIQFANPAFRRMFRCGESPLSGRPAKEFLRLECFEEAIASGKAVSFRTWISEHNLGVRAGIFPIAGGDLFAGIFVDVTEEEEARRTLNVVRAQTLERARQVIHQQMKTAQEIAGLLGETTAETKVLLSQLSDLFRREDRP
ncbi:MAG: PAS domain-containing protein [Planctomycetota bacterium]|nr:PAS domain-containing protein [Planctomycetota bacterium]